MVVIAVHSVSSPLIGKSLAAQLASIAARGSAEITASRSSSLKVYLSIAESKDCAANAFCMPDPAAFQGQGIVDFDLELCST